MGQWAVVQDGTVTQTVLADADVVEQFRAAEVYPGAQWVDVADVDPRPGPGWTYADGEFTGPVADEAPQDSGEGEDEASVDPITNVQATLDFLVMILTDTATDDGGVA